MGVCWENIDVLFTGVTQAKQLIPLTDLMIFQYYPSKLRDLEKGILENAVIAMELSKAAKTTRYQPSMLNVN